MNAQAPCHAQLSPNPVSSEHPRRARRPSGSASRRSIDLRCRPGSGCSRDCSLVRLCRGSSSFHAPGCLRRCDLGLRAACSSRRLLSGRLVSRLGLPGRGLAVCREPMARRTAGSPRSRRPPAGPYAVFGNDVGAISRWRWGSAQRRRFASTSSCARSSIEPSGPLAISLLSLLFPWSEAARVWPTASINNLAVCAYLLGTVVALDGLRFEGRRAVLSARHGSPSLPLEPPHL